MSSWKTGLQDGLLYRHAVWFISRILDKTCHHFFEKLSIQIESNLNSCPLACLCCRYFALQGID
jgi:hypothetical protein